MKITFDQAIDNYFNFIKLKRKPNTYRAIHNRIKTNILPYVKGKYLNDLTTFDYIDWQLKMEEKNYSIGYLNTLHTCFVTLLNYCTKFYGLKNNVASNVGKFKEKTPSLKNGAIWTIDEFNKFIKYVDDKVYKTFFKFLFFTGCRLGEALALTFNDIDLKTGHIEIRSNATRFFNDVGNRIITTPKTKKSMRTISIDKYLLEELIELHEYYNTKFYNSKKNFYVFGGNKILAPTTITRKKNYWCELAKVKIITIHEFRHSHACLLFQNDVPISDISYRLGHSNISMTTDIYLKYLPRDEKRVLNTLNSLRLLS